MPDGRGIGLQLRIGAFVLVGLGAFLAIIYLLGAQARYFERKYTLVAQFTEVGGLIEGATVRLAGVQIGRVTDVSLASEVGGKVRVTLTIARRFMDRIRRDSEARIVTQGLLGDKLIEISMGSPDKPPLQPGDTIATGEPFEMSRLFADSASALASVRGAAASLQAILERVDKTGVIDDVGATVKVARGAVEQLGAGARGGAMDDLAATMRSARRITEQVETGKGFLHTLVYDEPEQLRRLNALLASTQALLTQAREGDNAIAVLLSPDSAKATRSLLAAMDALGRSAPRAKEGETVDPGLLSALLFDPKYAPVADDLRAVAKSFREVSERLAKGQGLLGAMLRDDGGAETPTGMAGADFAVAMQNLRVITERLRKGEGTIGGLLEDPTVYENLAGFLEGAERSLLLRTLIRSSIGSGGRAAGGEAKPGKP